MANGRGPTGQASAPGPLVGHRHIDPLGLGDPKGCLAALDERHPGDHAAAQRETPTKIRP